MDHSVDLGIKCKTIKYLEGNTGESLDDLAVVMALSACHQRYNPWKKKLIGWTPLKLRKYLLCERQC